MVTESKIAVIATILGLLSASPAFAQSFDGDWGTGNELPSYHDQNAALHAGNEHMQSQVAVHRSAFASIGRVGFGSDSPSNTGGGSVGYNEMLQNDQW